MVKKSEIRKAFRDAIQAETDRDRKRLLRDLRKDFKDDTDKADDLTEAIDYVENTSPAAYDRQMWRSSISQVIKALPTFPDAGASGSVRSLRLRLRELLHHADSPQWLKDQCERFKRTYKIARKADDTPKYDQQNTDPIEAVAAAAIVVLNNQSTASPDQLREATSDLERWKNISPDE